MRKIELELTDSEGDTLYVVVQADRSVLWGWSTAAARERGSYKFNRREWEESRLRRPCIPFVEAALAALKEQGDV